MSTATLPLARQHVRWVLSALLVTQLACGGGDDHNGPSGNSVQDFIASVRSADGAANATFVAGSPPTAGSGPAVDVTTNASVIPGGTTQATLTATQDFTTIIISVQGADGYYRLTLPAASAAAQLLITLAQSLTGTSFNWVYGVGTGTTVGPYQTEPASVVVVGTGDVQVTLSWNTDADVDLHVLDPSDEEIYFAHRNAASGGELDLDSNAGCGSDGPRNENITWPTGGAPSGSYKVRVDYWSNCTATSTAYTVTVHVKGQDAQTFSGTLTGEGDNGGAGAGQDITTFQVGASTVASSTSPGVHWLGTAQVHLDPGARVHNK